MYIGKIAKWSLNKRDKKFLGAVNIMISFFLSHEFYIL